MIIITFTLLISILVYCNAIQKLKDDKGDIASTTKITVYGLKNNINSITSLLNSFEYCNSDNNALLYERKIDNNKQYLVINNIDEDRYDNNSDISLIYMPKESIINEDKILYRLQCAIQSSLGLEGEPKSNLIILIPEDSSDEYEKVCLSMARSAWTMILNKENYRHPELTQEINVIVTKPSKLVIQNVLDKIYELDSSNYEEPLIENLSIYIKSLSKKNDDINTITNTIKKQNSINMEAYQDAVEVSIEWARNSIKDSLTKLRQTTAPEKDFAIFVTNLLNGAIDIFVKKTSVETLSLSKSTISLGKDYITKELLSMMAPFFRHQIGLVRQESIKSFNEAAVDEITISPKIIEDLNEAKSKALKKFASDMSILIPNEAKSSWDISFDIYQLKDILDEYIDGRKVQCQLQGVLPRGRKPIDVSVHYFMNHPLGRDYRQDPLGFNEKDKIIFENSLVDSKDVSVHPDLARPILVEQSKVDSYVKTYGRNKIKSDSEFAREMLMFPLSIKNPSVPLMSGRSRRRGGPPKKDTNRESLGPERFIAWDVKPMDSIKKNIDQHIQSSSSSSLPSSNNQQTDIINKVINIIPTLSQGYYSHPSINYGPKYSASRK